MARISCKQSFLHTYSVICEKNREFWGFLNCAEVSAGLCNGELSGEGPSLAWHMRKDCVRVKTDMISL